MDWLEWNRELERDRDVLERILALLLSLAGLADRASGLPASHRLFGFLGHAEAEARGFVIGMAHECGAPAEAAASYPASQAERLAASFRALALLLGAMLWQARRLARLLPREKASRPGGSPSRRPAEPMVSLKVALLPSTPPDTS